MATASIRELAPTARSMRRMWLRTVSMLRCSSSAICPVERPRSSSASTSACRGVRCSSGCACGSSICRRPDRTHRPLLLVVQRDGAHLDRDPLAVGGDDLDSRVRDGCVPDELSGEQLPRTPRVLGRDDGGELATFHIADHAARCSVHPADDTGRIDHVARHVDVLEHLLDIHRLQHRRPRSSRNALCERSSPSDEARLRRQGGRSSPGSSSHGGDCRRQEDARRCCGDRVADAGRRCSHA